MLHLISSGTELWQSGVMVHGQSDLEHKNAASVWTPLTKGHFMDLDFTLWAHVSRVQLFEPPSKRGK
jgi:hypothetical protein